MLNRGYGTRRMGKWSPHQSFKPSPLGVIPGNWELRKLGELATPLAETASASCASLSPTAGARPAAARG